MTFPTCSSSTSRALLILAIEAALIPLASSQTPAAPTVRSHFSATPVPLERSRIATEQANEARPKTLDVRPLASPGGSTTTAPAEIVELARALNNDPDLIYQYVHDNVEFSPLFGYLKGPVGTLLDGRGDSFDQSALMVALLNQASLANPAISNAQFDFGYVYLSSAQLQSWLGVDSNPYSIGSILGSGGIPGEFFSDGSALVGHVWVTVSINGVPYVFDPAYKPHNWKTGIVSSLPTIMGYTQAAFIADANPTVTATTIQGVNRTQLRADLTTYASNLAAYIRTNAPTAGVSDVLGGGTIIPTPLTNGQTIRQTANPNQSGPPATVATLPAAYTATISITLPGASAYTFNSTDIYGHRLSIFFNSSYVPTLYLDGVAVVNGTAQTQGAQVPIAFSISIPWATFANQSHTQYISAQTNQNGGNGGYIVQTGWDQVGRGMIEKHRKLLNQAIASGATPNSEAVLGESLAVIGCTWLAELAAQQRINDQLLGTTTQYFYGGGIVGEGVGPTTTSPYVDLPLNFVNTPARINGASTQTANSLAAFLDYSGTSSSFEHTTLEQTQTKIPGFVAASTVKLLDIAIQNNDTIFDINNGNTSASLALYNNTIRPQMVPNYSAGTLSQIDSYVNQGYRVIAPLHGQIAVGAWKGVGFKTLYQNGTAVSYGEIISGGLSGGFGGANDPPASMVNNTVYAMVPGSYEPLSQNSIDASPGDDPTQDLGDPVDHLKGSYQHRHTDLTIGAKPFPYGLQFERIYDSGAQGCSGPLGSGWTHNFAMTASVGSDGFGGMGQASLLRAANSIAALYVSSDLMKGQALDGQSNIEYFALEAVVNRWFTDQLTNNVVNVTRGWTTETFGKVADGTYAPPVGSATILDAPNGTFRYRTKTGVTLTFNALGQIASWANAAGASVAFNYSGGQLSSVVNSATGRQLTLNYSGGAISSVSDGTRSVSYGYSNGNLTGFTDPLGQNTTYAYDTTGVFDTAGHLTQIFYPSNPTNPFVSTFYDSLGRVKQQKDAIGNLTQAFFAGSRSEIDDPAGNRNVWYNDPRGNVTTTIQDYGYAPHLNVTTVTSYDAQNNVSAITLPEGNSTSFVYDALFNPVTVTRTPKPGSALSPLTQTLTYTVPVSGLPNFEELAAATDPKGNTTSFTYNSTTGTLATITQPSVTKPGAGAGNPREQFTYTAIGLPQTAQDAEGRTTRSDYDPTHADQVTKVTVDYGRLNLITQFGYDALGDRNSVTDANGHTATSIFDNLRRVTEVDGAIPGVVTKFTYTPDGKTASVARQVTPGTWETTQYAYTLSDKPRLVTDPLGNTTTSVYDLDDRPQSITTQVTATQNRQRTFTYDPLSRPLQIIDSTVSPGTVLETHAYTLNGREQSFTDANGHATTYAYDGLDRLNQRTYPDATSERFQYDANGNPLQKTARSGQTISFAFDALNRMITKTPAGEAAGQVAYGYDLSGLLLQAADQSSATPYQIAYDTAGRANSFTDQLGRNTQVQYDGVGNRTRLQWPANTNGANPYFVTYVFDALNRMNEIDANGSAATPLAKYQWDSLSRPTLITYGDGTTDAYSQYDAGDNLLTLSESFAGGTGNVTFSYGYLKNHQRQSTVVSNSAFQFIPGAGSTSYSTDVDNAYTSAAGNTLAYDGNHNLTSDGFNTLSYDVENRLIQAQNGAWGTSQYLFDPLGHRKQKSVNGVTTQFVLAGNDEIADYSGASSGPGTPLLLTVRGGGGLPVAAVAPSSGVVTYYHHDILGSTVAVSQAGTSGPADISTYGTFGEAGSGSWATYRYAGYRYDNETGLYYAKSRIYSPQLGRFLQTDTIGYAGGRNLYGYVNNDPINGTDPLGTCDDIGPDCDNAITEELLGLQDQLDALHQQIEDAFGSTPSLLHQFLFGNDQGGVGALYPLEVFATIATLAEGGEGGALIEAEAAALDTSGTAVVNVFGRTHFNVTVMYGSESVTTGLTAVGKDAVVQYESAAGATSQFSVALPDAKTALEFAQNAGAVGSSGTYSVFNNSCASYCGEVLTAGGVEGIPAGTSGFLGFFKLK
jgi:RHS repeat-associated protein